MQLTCRISFITMTVAALVGLVRVPAAHASPQIDIQIAVGLMKPPYIMAPGQGGLEYEIAEQALAFSGYRMVPRYFPPARALGLLRAKQLGGMLGVTEGIGGNDHFSEPYIVYQNVAITLLKSNLFLNSVEDLSTVSIAAFQNAGLVLGERFRAMVAGHADYKEYAQQITQNRLLYTGRVDAVVGDRLIFRYFNRELKDTIDTSQPVSIHPVFPPTPRKAVFLDPKVRDAFNAGLKGIRQNGSYAAIYKKYQQYLDTSDK